MDADMDKNLMYYRLCQTQRKIRTDTQVVQHDLIEPRYGYSHSFTKNMRVLYDLMIISLPFGCDGITSADYPLDVEFIKIGNDTYLRLTNMWYGCLSYETPSYNDGKTHPYIYPNCIKNNLMDGYPGNDITQKKPYIKNLTKKQIQFIYAHFENIKKFIKNTSCLKNKKHYNKFREICQKIMKQIENLLANENLNL
jgi:hypothetical protein